MTSKIERLDQRLTELGWTTSEARFGRQSWRRTTTDGSAVIEVHVEGNGVVGSFVLYADHPAGEDDGWSEEVVRLELGPNRESPLRVHQTEESIALNLARFAELLATTVEDD